MEMKMDDREQQGRWDSIRRYYSILVFTLESTTTKWLQFFFIGDQRCTVHNHWARMLRLYHNAVVRQVPIVSYHTKICDCNRTKSGLLHTWNNTMKTLPKLVLLRGNSPAIVGFSSQNVNNAYVSCFPLLNLNNRLSAQSGSRWSKMSRGSCGVTVILGISYPCWRIIARIAGQYVCILVL